MEFVAALGWGCGVMGGGRCNVNQDIWGVDGGGSWF